jgi:hypothetical protein
MRAPLVGRLRPSAHRPAPVADRPLQPALHVLHAGRGLDWLPKPELLTDDELVRLVRVLASWACARCGSRAASRCCGPGLPGLVPAGALDLALSLTTNGLGLAVRRRRCATPACAG